MLILLSSSTPADDATDVVDEHCFKFNESVDAESGNNN